MIRLTLALQAPGRGLCLEDIQARFEVGRRTAERMRETVERIYPDLRARKGDDGRKYWSLPRGRADGLIALQSNELRALDETIREAAASFRRERARLLASLRDKLYGLGETGRFAGPRAVPDAEEPRHDRAVG